MFRPNGKPENGLLGLKERGDTEHKLQVDE